ncbi:UDP-N-acetylmuramoyl-L-alanine--D-glutamate ligase [Candidatus Berkelbacteria bacterium]|nr:UDP-N-acetylmuramoyl-L-alanine--D-glutamate ligase [Candidatus Berkelbacteria bacterium]
MELTDFAFKRVALIGGAVENLSVLPLLVKSGANVTICEQSKSPTLEKIKQQFPKVEQIIGEQHLENLDRFDVLFRSPGVPIERIDKSLAGKENQPIRTSAIDLFLALCPAITIGVTGTKGKGTTSTLIGSILEQTEKKIYVLGNIGKPVFDVYPELTEDDIAVLELSSFQLEDVTHSPKFAVMLPMGIDHLQPLSARSPNFHKSMDVYVNAKSKITAFQTPNDLLVFNADNQYSSSIAENSNARKISVGLTKSADFYYTAEGKFLQNGEEIIDFKELGLRGEHIFLDAALATALTLELGVTIEQIKLGIKNYQPLPHRLEKIATIGGVSYWDDSYATAPDAAISAIKAFDEPIVWIGGGSTKGANFEELAKIVNQKATLAILLGQEADRIEKAIKQVNPKFKIERAESIEQAVLIAISNAKSGEAVLLSPACASLDMFKSAADRGERFVNAVKGSDVGAV